MRLVDVTAQGLLDLCRGLGVKAHMHPCLGCVIVENAPRELAVLILDSSEYWKYGDLSVYVHFKGWMCVMPREEWM